MNGFGTALLSLTTYHPSGTLSAAVDFFFFLCVRFYDVRYDERRMN